MDKETGMITKNSNYYNRKSIDDSYKLMTIGVIGALLTILGLKLYQGWVVFTFFIYIYKYI